PPPTPTGSRSSVGARAPLSDRARGTAERSRPPAGSLRPPDSPRAPPRGVDPDRIGRDPPAPPTTGRGIADPRPRRPEPASRGGTAGRGASRCPTPPC